MTTTGYKLDGLTLDRQHIKNILDDLRSFQVIDSTTYLSQRGALKSDIGVENVGRFLKNCGFLHSAFQMNGVVHSIIRVQLEAMERELPRPLNRM